MKVLVLGGDGYLGWPTAMHFAAQGHEVMVVDNYLRRFMAKETDSDALIEGPNMHIKASKFLEIFGSEIAVRVGDISDKVFLDSVVRESMPDTIVHFAEQPSAPYSMKGYAQAKMTLDNNLSGTFTLIWSVLEHCPEAHIIKLGTMGEYGTPNIDIEEGWLDVEHNGRSHKFLYPRQASSLYHTTKVLDTDLLWFYVRLYGLRVTDLMQGPVYGLFTEQSKRDDSLLPNFHYDDIFGTVVNRFICQAVAGIPLTVFGKGGQTRGYLNLVDTLQCIEVAAENPSDSGEMRIFNQFTEQFTVNELAARVVDAGAALGLAVQVETVPNPRVEQEEHYYNAKHSGLEELGMVPTLLSSDVLVEIMNKVLNYRENISAKKAMPRVRWS